MTFDKIYTDITTQVIPKIAEGVAITKDYAFDLFGRYIQYLIISDSIYLTINIIIFTLTIYYGIKLFKWYNSFNNSNHNGTEGLQYLLLLIPGIALIISFINILDYSEDLIKDLTIPEVRVYELYKSNNK